MNVVMRIEKVISVIMYIKYLKGTSDILESKNQLFGWFFCVAHFASEAFGEQPIIFHIDFCIGLIIHKYVG